MSDNQQQREQDARDYAEAEARRQAQSNRAPVSADPGRATTRARPQPGAEPTPAPGTHHSPAAQPGLPPGHPTSRSTR
ncbi:hypothetical protein NKH18_01295 [Streptomyces sp. M10(2022)]